MARMSRQRGGILLLLMASLAAAAAAMFALGVAGPGARLAQERNTEHSLARARDALLAHATARAIDPVVGPGYLPCPDRDGDGWAEPTCGSLSGDSGQAQRLGRLPWKTLGLGELRDGHGAPLWYAVSTKFKGLLNCAASADCVDMAPRSALGTITLRDATGAIVLDGRVAGAAAVVIAPGPALRSQVRGCDGACEPRDYLESVPGIEDNTAFSDRGADGFIQGPVRGPGGEMVLNDRILAIDASAIVARMMARVAREVAACLLAHAGPGISRAPCRPRNADDPGERAPFSSCNVDESRRPGWWNAWREFVAYDLAPERHFAVVVRAVPRAYCDEAHVPDDAGLPEVVLTHP